MRPVLIALFALINTLIFAQSACDNHNSLKGKSESDYTDIKRLKIYWSKRCACEQGNITGGTWDYTVKLVNDNYRMYRERRNKYPEQYKNIGSILPDRKISANECNNDDNFNYNSTGNTNCKTNTFPKEKDPQNFANDFMLARCQCLEGVPYEEQAKNLELAMQTNFQNAKKYYGNSLGMPDPIRWEDCYNVRLGQDPTVSPGSIKKTDKWALYKDDLINDDARSIIGILANNSNNPELKQLSQDLDNLSMPNQQLADYRSFFNITPTQADIEFENVMTNVAQGVAVFKFIWNSIARKIQQKKAEKRQKIAWEKRQGRTAIYRIWNNLNSLHMQAGETPHFSDYNQAALDSMDALEQNYYSFDIATAPERKFLIEYYYGDNWYNVQQIQARVAELTAMDRIEVLKEIDSWQNKHPELANSSQFDHSNAHSILANADVSFETNRQILNGYKSLCYLEMGDTIMAEKLREDIDYELVERNLLKSMKDAAYKNDQRTIELLLPQLRVYLEYKRLSGNLSSTTIEQSVMKKILNKETVLLYSNGIKTSIDKGDLKKAEENILFLKQGMGLMNQNQTLSSTEKEQLSVLQTLEAMLLIKRGELSKGKVKIEQAINNSVSYSDSKFWKFWIKFKLLVEMKEYDAAHLWYNKVIKDFTYMYDGDAALFDINELKFAKCQLLFEQKKYDRILKGLDMLETVSPKLKYNQLRYKVFLKQGLTEKANAELLKLKL